VTQQNAALVEESAAAAESLRMQALQLVQAVAVFKLGVGDGARAVVASKPSSAVSSERRGEVRAKNITRPAFGKAQPAKRQPGAAVPAGADVARTGTDNWESF
jgi:hypothetical protein